jgi:hypothetical protein
MKKSLLVLVTSALLITLFPGAAKASPGETATYPLICASSGWIYLYLDYGVDAVTITNPNACSGAQILYIVDGRSSTWTYSQTISGTTTSGSYDPTATTNFQTGAIGSSDSFTLTLASAISNYITISGGVINLKVYFNTQFNTLSPDPVAIGQQVTVTGSNLSDVSSIFFMGSSYFSVTTANRTATQLTFTVPLTYYDSMSRETQTVMAGNYRINAAPGKTLTLTAAPIVVSVSAEEVARLAAVAAAAATAQREVGKISARTIISSDFKNFANTKLDFFKQAEINGITAENLEAVQAEITALPEHSSGDIAGILKIARKYEVVSMIASDRVTSVYSDALVEIGLIPADSKHKAALTSVIKNLPVADRSSFAAIKAAVDAELAEIQRRNNRSKAILARIASHRS